MSQNQRIVNLEVELQIAIREVKTGLRELNRDGAEKDFYHLPILLVTAGIERFLKVIASQHALATTGKQPDGRDFIAVLQPGGLSHIRGLFSKVAHGCFSREYLTRLPVLAQEIQILNTDERVLQLIDILADFSTNATYYNLNLMSEMEPPGACQEDELEKMRMDIAQTLRSSFLSISDPGERSAVDREICFRITTSSEICMRSLTQIAVWTLFDGDAGRLSEVDSHFLRLSDAQLGRFDYGVVPL